MPGERFPQPRVPAVVRAHHDAFPAEELGEVVQGSGQPREQAVV